LSFDREFTLDATDSKDDTDKSEQQSETLEHERSSFGFVK
jgi:hypothetical protein